MVNKKCKFLAYDRYPKKETVDDDIAKCIELLDNIIIDSDGNKHYRQKIQLTKSRNIKPETAK